MVSSSEVKVSTTAKPPTIKAGQPPVSLSINLKYKTRLLDGDGDDDDTLVTWVSEDVAVPLSALVSYGACKCYLILKVIPSMNIDPLVGEEVARQISWPLVEEARKGLSRVAGCGISVEAQVEISVGEQNERITKLRDVLVNIDDDDDDMTVGEDCAVCLEGLSGAGKILETPCSHIFHSRCIFTWLLKHDSCPMCRSSITGTSNFILWS